MPNDKPIARETGFYQDFYKMTCTLKSENIKNMDFGMRQKQRKIGFSKKT